jgi:hypothetical protein
MKIKNTNKKTQFIYTKEKVEYGHFHGSPGIGYYQRARTCPDCQNTYALFVNWNKAKKYVKAYAYELPKHKSFHCDIPNETIVDAYGGWW